MQAENKLKLLFAINPVSGGSSRTDWLEGIRTYLDSLPHLYCFLILDGENDAERVREQIKTWQPDRVVAVGGDGTVKLVAEQLMGSDIPLGILPAGSANGMARDIGIPTTIDESLNIILNGSTEKIDAILINDEEICLHLSDIGMNAQLIKYYQENNWRGKLGYARGVIRVLMRRRQMHVTIHLKDQVVEREAVMIVLANARMYGTGAVINPKGRLEDGYFEVVVMHRLPFWEILKMFWRFQPFNPKVIEIFKASSVDIQTKRLAYFQVDGEYMGRVRDIKAKILAGQLTVMMPVTSPEPATET